MKKSVDVMFREAEEILTQAKGLMDGEVDDEVQAQVDGLLAQAEKLQKDAERLQKLTALEQANTANEAQAAPEGKMGGRLSDQVLGSENYKNWLGEIAPGGYVSKAKVSTLPRISVSSHIKELITGGSPVSAGAFITPDDTGIYEAIGRYPTVIRDLVSLRTTNTDTVEFVRQTHQVTEAEVTPEANVKYPIGYPGEVDGKKPQGMMRFERVQKAVDTIPVYVGATKQALADVGQMRGLIDEDLRGDLTEKVEQYALDILANTAGTLTQGYDTDVFRTARLAITTLKVLGRQRPSAFLFHPTDWAEIELQQDGEDRYYYAGPTNQGPARLWGVPVVESYFVAEGSAWLANWKKAVLWDRQQTTITATDSHEDWFIRNMIAILAEMRLAFDLIRPSAFVEVELS